MCLEKPDIFKTQIRAIMRSARHGQVGIMIPMVSTLEEVKGVRRLMEECRRELESSRIPHSGSIKMGLMIEVPSAALLADRMAREVDFLSIGTNDLTQYTLAVDRNNKRVAHLYDTLNPAILNLIAMTARAAREADIPLAVCGEIAADPLWTPLLIGLGVQKLSMNASSIPLIKRSIRLIRHADCQRAARRALKAGTSAEVRRIMSRFEKMIQAQVVYHPRERERSRKSGI
jgi:phosphotransferase system enzyme I (PtsI)